MKTMFILLTAVISLAAIRSNGQIFWTENFESGSASGMDVTGYTTGPNGPWTMTITGSEGDVPNQWYVSCAEAGHTVGGCGTTCAGSLGLGATLHVGSGSVGDMGASYDNGGLCGIIYCVQTDRRAESPAINCTGKYGIRVRFYYIENGDGAIDDGTVWYYDGSVWSSLVNSPKTPPICPSGQGYWDTLSYALPASADNNPNVKIGFRWVNNDDASGSDPSYAIDSLSLIATSGASFSMSSSTTCQDSCVTFTNTSSGTVSSYTWSSSSGYTSTSSVASPVTICFSVAGVYTVSLTATGATASTATHTVTVVPTPHPVIHYAAGHILSVTGAYTAYQWASGTPIPSPITGATNSSYTVTSGGTYYVGVDSAGCKGFSATPFIFSPLAADPLSGWTNDYWYAQNGSRGRITLYSGSSLAADISVTVYEATGRAVISDTWAAGSNTTAINGADLPPGLYIIKLSNRNTSTVLRWLK
jgi:type IX secretion system substrate protein